VGGLAVLFRSCLYGTAVLLQSRFDAATYHAAIDRQQVTLTSLVPTMLYRLLATRKGPWPASLRLVLLGGAAASPALIAAAERQQLPVATTYGLTEAASQVATALPATVTTKPGTVGKPLLFTSIRIIGPDGDILPGGEIGEVVVRGPGVMPGYLDDAAATASTIRAGELYTGDMGYLDGDGDLWIVQRRSELIVSGGENVYPAEVEQVLDAHPAVSRSCVVGIDDVEWGQRVAALVELATEEEVAASTLLDFAAERLAAYKRPRQLFFTAELPQTASGKIARQTVREWITGQAAQTAEEPER
jgi:O-succinylbenzoic acid--CoA ligase